MGNIVAAMRAIRLHDTRTGQLRELVPREPGRVGIYACGPTVYGRIHVGNARPYVVFSLLKRFLVHEGYNVTFVANITDVNDKIYDAARATGVSSDELAREMTDAYVRDTDTLGLGRPDHEPRASETIAAIIELIEELIAGGHAYQANGDVYFSVASYPNYGELSHQQVDQMDQGEGVEGADLKRAPVDFALWKSEKPTEDTAWESPWGRGRPDGTSSARRWPRGCSGPTSRSTAAVATSFSPTTRTKRRRRARGGAIHSHSYGSTTAWSGSTGRRWPSRWATSSFCTRRSRPTGGTRSSCTSAEGTTASRSSSTPIA